MPHIHEKIDFTAEVFIVHNNRVLLRVHDKYKKWLSVGGHVELDEDPNEAAVREAKEEVGLDITLIGKPQAAYNTNVFREIIPPLFMNRHRVNEMHEHVTLSYAATCATDEVHVEHTSDASHEWKWFTESELDDAIYAIWPHVKMYAKKALAVVREQNN